MLPRLIARSLYWGAQGTMALGRPGARIARRMLLGAQSLDSRLVGARGWQCVIEGLFARDRGELDEAAQLLREASAILRDNDMVIANLGIALAMGGHHDEAIEVIERAIRGETDLTAEGQVWVALAWSYLRSGRGPKALQTCDRAEDSNVSSPDVRVLRVLAYAANHGLVRREELRQLLRLRPGMLPLVLEFTQHLAHKGTHSTAQEIIRCLPDRVQSRACYVIAKSALNEDELNTASWAIKQLGKLSPTSPTPFMLRSEVALRQGHLDASLRHAKDAVTLQRRDAEPLEQLVRVRLGRGQWDAAVKTALAAVERRGSGALPGGVAALHLLEAGERDKAKKLFAVERSGDDVACAFAHTAQALIFALGQDPRSALDLATDAVDEMGLLPPWARNPAVVDHLSAALERTLQLLAESDDPPPTEALELLNTGLDSAMETAEAGREDDE